MLPDDVAQTLRDWLKSEGLEVRERQDDRTTGHLLVRYPSTKHGHVFNLACPTGRDLVVIGSLTQVDVGQQEQMSTLAKEDPVAWNAWLHETRLQLTRAEVDWVLHVGHSNDGNGPLQAFHISEPTWRDGLSKHRLMSSLRRLWLAKLAIIHEIKFAYGPGEGKPGPVDDWERRGKKSRPPSSSDTVLIPDEDVGFGEDFDPSHWA